MINFNDYYIRYLILNTFYNFTIYYVFIYYYFIEYTMLTDESLGHLNYASSLESQ